MVWANNTLWLVTRVLVCLHIENVCSSVCPVSDTLQRLCPTKLIATCVFSFVWPTSWSLLLFLPFCLAHTVESATSDLLFLLLLVSSSILHGTLWPCWGSVVSWRSLLPSYWWSNFNIYIYIHTLPSHVRGLATLVELQVALINRSTCTRAAQPCVSALIIIYLCSAGGGGQSIFTHCQPCVCACLSSIVSGWGVDTLPNYVFFKALAQIPFSCLYVSVLVIEAISEPDDPTHADAAMWISSINTCQGAYCLVGVGEENRCTNALVQRMSCNSTKTV